MREETKREIGDRLLTEALNDGIVDMVTKARFMVKGNRHEDQWQRVTISPALAYLLIDELEFGVNVPPGTGQISSLLITIPEGWDVE